MQNLLLFFARYGSILLFVLLEVFCFNLIVNRNTKQRDIYLHSSSLISGEINNRVNNVQNYLELRRVNDSLRVENAKLLQRILNIPELAIINEAVKEDSSLIHYEIVPATICSNSTRLRNNHLTLCQGTDHGIIPGLGVITDDGLVGIVKNVSSRFAQVLSLLNSQTRISAMVENKNYFGNLVWRGFDPRIMHLEAIPKHVDISTEDKIVTSGFSTMFPKGIEIGKIKSFKIPSGSDNYEIEVELIGNLYTAHTVYVIKNNFKEEQSQLELSQNEQ